MKNKFSTAWKASSQPRKQRKYAANAPLHLKKKMISCSLSKELRKKYSKRNITLRVGDEVKIVKGKFKKKQGKVIRIKRKKLKIFIEGIQAKKKDGSKTDIPFKASKLQIIELNLDDKKRLKALEKSSHTENPKEKKHAS